MALLAFSSRLPRSLGGVTLGLSLGLLGGCDNYPATGQAITTGTYEAIATVTYTWQAEYARSFDRPQTIRQEQFASTTLVNRNGLRPEGAVTGPDDAGLWWPALPPRPSADELEERQRESNEKRTDPLLQKDVTYAITFDYDGQRRTLPTNPSVYREAVKAYADQQALELTYGPGQQSIGAARRIASFDR
ncbi:MAG TPA: hypothetical protein IGR64_12195 [Leptolyngbyaceae cyanobacterium M65_K2018_010]|nr:hypothetical protein [Leptolyngbyaceae cyanobacterium M65_K2018_010]